MKTAVRTVGLITLLLACGCRSTLNLTRHDIANGVSTDYATIKGLYRPLGYGANVKILAVDTNIASAWSSCYTAYTPPGKHFVIVCGNHTIGLPRIGVALFPIERVSAPIHFTARSGHQYEVTSSIGWCEGPLATHTLHFELLDVETDTVVGEASQWSSAGIINLNKVITFGSAVRAGLLEYDAIKK